MGAQGGAGGLKWRRGRGRAVQEPVPGFKGKAEETQDGQTGQDCRKAFSVRTDAFSDTKMAIRSNPNDPDG